jgi:hypothetical protein
MGASALASLGLSEPAMLEAIACREALTLAHDLHVLSVLLLRIAKSNFSVEEEL